MPNSMTAYGRATSKTSFGHLVVEMQSVNRKHLEIQVVLPKELTQFEADVRQWLSGTLHRGQITVRVHATYDAMTPIRVTPNLPLARELKKAWDAISQSLGVNSASHFHLEMLAHETELFSYETMTEDEGLYRDALQQTLQQALVPFIEMRKREGYALELDIRERIALMHKHLELIAGTATNAPQRYREKLMATLEQILPVSPDNAERVVREVCLFADRIDIAEELTRAQSHLQQLQWMLSSQEPQLGKTLEFLLQELFREVNTIASKSSEIAISHAVVALKTEIERIREQVQNIE